MNLTTKQSLVYVFRAVGTSRYKLGVTTNLRERLRAVQTGCPYRVVVVGTCPGERSLEAALHSRFAAHRRQGEWFMLPQSWREDARDLVPAFQVVGQKKARGSKAFEGWKRSRFLPGYQLRRVPGYNIVETPWGVSYLGVLSRKPDRTSADKSVFGFAGYFNWDSLILAGLAAPAA